MTVKQMYDRALVLLGETDFIGVKDDAEILKQAITIVDVVGEELHSLVSHHKWQHLTDCNEEIPLPDNALSVMPYGVAMWIAKSEGDMTQQSYFATLYTQKQAKLTRIRGMRDVL